MHPQEIMLLLAQVLGLVFGFMGMVLGYLSLTLGLGKPFSRKNLLSGPAPGH